MAKIYCIVRESFNKIINLEKVTQIFFNKENRVIEFVFQNGETSTVHFNSFNDLLNEYEIIKRIMSSY